MKQKLQDALKKLSGMNLARTLVLALVAKAIFIDVTLSTVLLTVPILGYEAYKMWLASKTPDPVRLNSEVKQQMDQMNAKLTALTMDKNVKSPNARVW